MARPRIPVLVGTVALLAGCGSQARVEVSGTVRDGETGRVIANALVVGADGTSTRTDAEGRFSLFVRGDQRRSIRASAFLHEDGVAYFDPREDDSDGAMAFALAPLHGPALIEEDDPDAVIRWLREAWLDDDRETVHTNDAPRALGVAAFEATVFEATVFEATVFDGETIDGEMNDGSWSRDAVASLDQGAFERREALVTIAHAGAMVCGACHTTEDAMVSTAVATASRLPPDRFYAPHAGLDGGCLACHGERSADGLRVRPGLESDLEPARCTGCHASTRGADLRALRAPAQLATARAEAAFSRAVAHVTQCGHVATSVGRIEGTILLLDVRLQPLGDCNSSGAIDGTEIAIGLEVLDPRVARAAEDLVRLHSDRSRGIHQPALTRALAYRIERALH